MNQNDKKWLENRISASVEDDYYLDRDEEKRLKEESAAKGIDVRDADLVIREELAKIGAVCERVLLEELDKLLHQFTDNDKRLDGKEERDALDKVLIASHGKRKGLDPRVAEEYVNSFCRVNGVRRDSEIKRWLLPLLAGVGSISVLGLAFFMLSGSKDNDHAKSSGPEVVSSQNGQTSSISGVILTDTDRAEIDDQIRRAMQFVEMAQYTDPPEKSAKACLEKIHQIDPSGKYRVGDIRRIVEQIVDHYLALADKSHADNDLEGVSRWLGRAKLMGANSEIIREKERSFGLLVDVH